MRGKFPPHPLAESFPPPLPAEGEDVAVLSDR
jgi:hypothetical protein